MTPDQYKNEMMMDEAIASAELADSGMQSVRRPVQDSFIDKVIEDIDNVFMISQDGFLIKNDNGFCKTGNINDIKTFIRQALEEQARMILDCLPEFKVRDPYDEDFDYTRWNDCLDQFLKNLRDKGIIK